MISILKWIILTLFNILPDSPFRPMIESLELQDEYLQYMNWFLPLDIVGNMMLVWLDCVLLYVLYYIISRIMITIVKTFIQIMAQFAAFFI